MGEVTLQPGEREKIISQPGADQKYNIQVSGADVFLSHRSGLVVSEGKRIRPGDRVEVSNLQGKPLYVKNPASNGSTATVEVSEASFALFFQPRAVQASVQTNNQDESAPATDDFTEATGSAVDISNGGNVVESLTPPGRSDQVSFYVEPTAEVDVNIAWNNTDKTFSGKEVEQVVPVYYISDPITITITDTSGGSNTVDYDIAII
jgi:hypothetical protein